MYEFSSVKRYGVYEFLVIFLCANFLAYYKCHFNFIQGRTVNDETCEYLYDSIVSVRVQEKSSTKSNSGEDKDKERQFKSEVHHLEGCPGGTHRDSLVFTTTKRHPYELHPAYRF